jgi:hypothetical protein
VRLAALLSLFAACCLGVAVKYGQLSDEADSQRGRAAASGR